MGYQTFMDLDAWKEARRFKLAVYAILKRFPDHERFELTSQLRKAVRSIPTNIAEGHGRRTVKDQNNLCIIARGSHSETMNHLIDAYDCGYISESELVRFKEQWDVTGKLLNGYMAFLQSRIPSAYQSNPSGNIEEEEVTYHSDNSVTNNADFLQNLSDS